MATANPFERLLTTYEQLRALPDNLVGELLHGELYTQPRPAIPHARASTSIAGQLWAPFDRPLGEGGPGGWILLHEPEIHLGGDVVVPDLAGWRRERVPRVPDAAFMDVVPDWICEVLSPRSTEERDREIKMPLYGATGVRHAWLVDPSEQVIEVYRSRLVDAEPGVRAARVLRRVNTFRGNVDAAIEPFDALPFRVGALWSR